MSENTKVQPTEGPWIVGPYSSVWVAGDIALQDGKWVHTCDEPRLITTFGRDPESQANAHLTAAAHELLTLARDYRRTIEYNVKRDMRDGDDEGASLKRFTLEHVDRVIAKAEGGAS